MRVTIVDVEWFARKSFTPNLTCMKISSYHKQLGDIVNFPNSQVELMLQYDVMYVVREGIEANLPEGLPVRGRGVRLIGHGFRFYSNYVKEMDELVAACRPDYNLYPLKESNVAYNTQYAQFFSKGKFLERKQDYKASGRLTKETIIADKEFWHYKVEELEKCVHELRFETNVVFQYPLPLEVLFKDKRKQELFFALNLKNEQMKLSEADAALGTLEETEAFLDRLVKEKPKFPMPIMYTSIDYTNHLVAMEYSKNEFIRLFKLVGDWRRKGKRLAIPLPVRIETPSWQLFEALHTWTTKYSSKTFVEFMTHGCCFIHKVSFDELVKRPELWTTDFMKLLKELERDYPGLIDDYGYIKTKEITNEKNLRGEYIWLEKFS